MNCDKTGCSNEATVGLALNVPAVGVPIPEHDPIKIVIGLRLCEKCISELKAEEFLGADGRLKKIIMIAAKGKADPDFERAFLTGIPFESQEWQILQRNKK